MSKPMSKPMSGPKNDDETDWSIEAARAADAKSAHDIVILDVGPVLAVCGRFVIASATNTRQVRSVVDAVAGRTAPAAPAAAASGSRYWPGPVGANASSSS